MLKSENSTPMPPTPPIPPPSGATPKSRRKLTIASILIIVVVIAAVLGFWLLRSGGGNQSWIFKGAYANYQGQETLAGLGYTLNMTIHMEVLGFNSTEVEILSNTTSETGLGTPFSYNYTSWMLRTSANDFNVEGGNLTNSYDTTVTLSNLGKRNCIAYEYSISGTNQTMTVYVDKTVDFPVEWSVTSTGTPSLNFDVTLVSTNIPGL